MNVTVQRDGRSEAAAQTDFVQSHKKVSDSQLVNSFSVGGWGAADFRFLETMLCCDLYPSETDAHSGKVLSLD